MNLIFADNAPILPIYTHLHLYMYDKMRANDNEISLI